MSEITARDEIIVAHALVDELLRERKELVEALAAAESARAALVAKALYGGGPILWDDCRLGQVAAEAENCGDACRADLMSLVAEVRRIRALLDQQPGGVNGE